MYLCIAVSGRNRVPTTYVFDQSDVRIGRSSKNDIVFDPVLDGAVSRRHCVIHRNEYGEFFIEDLESTQGTFLNNAPVQGKAELRPNDQIVLGMDGPRLHVVFEKTEDSTMASMELVRAAVTTHFPLALYQEFPRKFRLYQKIGEGGYGQVWRALRREKEEWMAVKFLRPELLICGGSQTSQIRISKQVARFQREAQVTKLLATSGVPGIIHVDETGGDSNEGFLFMIMDYIDGDSLDKFVSRASEMPIARICRYMRQVAIALDKAHQINWTDEMTGRAMKGVIHRDIKPSNIMIRKSDDMAILCDFGIAAIQEGGDRLTLPQMRVFTYKFTAPEVLIENTISPSTDLWGLAVTAYVMLSGGFFPYGGMGLAETLRAIREGKMAPLRGYRNDISHELANFIQSSLNPDIAKRPQTAHDWVDALEPYIS